jgi:large subunit ribosomal protein L6
MSRVGRNPVAVPAGVTVQVAGQTVTAKGKFGELRYDVAPTMEVKLDGNQLWVKPRQDSARVRPTWGTQRALLKNLVQGVNAGFQRALVINGVGFRAAAQGKVLTLQLGFSHDVTYKVPEGLTIACTTPQNITISGADRQKVGQAAAEIRALRKPEPYKGKGIRYAEEEVLRKEGKKK